MNVNLAIPRTFRRASAIVLAIAALAATSTPARAQGAADSATGRPSDSLRILRRHFHQKMAAGFIASVLIHESSHFAASYLMGVHPHVGLSGWRPTVYSGLNEGEDARKQFIFSAAGPTIQDLLDEAILDFPHTRGGAFERGLLSGGIGTTLFYVSLGRNASVSDISVMARTSSLSKTQLSLIFGSVAAMHALRIALDHHYARFFAAPTAAGGVRAGVSIGPN